MNAHTIDPFAPQPWFAGNAMHQGPQVMSQEINNDLLFMSLMVNHQYQFRRLSSIEMAKALTSLGYTALFTEEQTLVLEAFASGRVYGTIHEVISSPHRHFILRVAGMPSMYNVFLSYVKTVIGIAQHVDTPQALNSLIDACRVKEYAAQLQQDPWKGRIRTHVCGVPMPKPVLDHGFRPRRPNNVQAGNNSVLVYNPDMAPLILNADMETTYHINGFYVLFHMNNFSSFNDVEVEVHESTRNDLPGLLATEMDGNIFRRYFDPVQRVENIKALSLVIR